MEILEKIRNDQFLLRQRVEQAIKNLKPFDIREKFESEYEDRCDMLIDMPQDFTTDKNGFMFISLAIVGKNANDTLICEGMGEDQGEEFTMDMRGVELDSLLDLLSILEIEAI